MRPHRKKTEWFPVKYFIIEEILTKGPMSVERLHRSVNNRLGDCGEGKVYKQKLVRLLEEIRKQIPPLQVDNNDTIDCTGVISLLLKNLPKQHDSSTYLEKIVRETGDPSMQILKLLWKFEGGKYPDIYQKPRNLEQNPGQKTDLVTKVCDLLKLAGVHHVMLSTGVTMFELARQILTRHGELGIETIISSNMLIHVEFLLSKIAPASLLLGLPPGKLHFQHDTASFGHERGLTDAELDSDTLKAVQASVLSFTSLSFDEGFKIGLGYQADVNEKLFHLLPPQGVRLVIILIDWEKILAGAGGNVVQDAQGRKGHELFDLSNGRQYLIMTNRPDDVSSDLNRRRIADLERWAAAGHAIVLDTEDKLRAYKAKYKI